MTDDQARAYLQRGDDDRWAFYLAWKRLRISYAGIFAPVMRWAVRHPKAMHAIVLVYALLFVALVWADAV